MTPRFSQDDIYLAALKTIFWVFCVGVIAFAARAFWPVISTVLDVMTPFIVGLVLAYIFHPIVLFVQDRLRLGRVMGILVVAGCIVLLMTIFFAILVPMLYQQFAALLEALNKFMENRSGDTIFARFVPDEDRRQELLQAAPDTLSVTDEVRPPREPNRAAAMVLGQ